MSSRQKCTDFNPLTTYHSVLNQTFPLPFPGTSCYKKILVLLALSYCRVHVSTKKKNARNRQEKH